MATTLPVYNTNTRRVTLLNDPYTNELNELPWVLGQDVRGFQYEIALDALPPGITLDMIKQNQVWFVNNDSTAYRLVYYAGTDTTPLSISGTETGIVPSGLWGTGYYGSFYDTTTQTLVSGAGVGIPMLLNSVDDANGFVVNSGSRITAQQYGVYNLEFSAQLDQTDNSNDLVSIWLRKNGSDVAESNTYVNMPKQSAGNYSTNVAAWNWLITLASGDYAQIMWGSGDSASVVLRASGVLSYAPAVPSVIATIQQIALVESGGIAGITQLTGDVLAGPGTGSQVATLQDTPNVENIISNSAAIATLSGRFGNYKYFNIYDYGTVDPTGVVDCSTAVSGAQAALKANGGGMLFFPPGGTYKIQTGLLTRVSGSDKRYGIDATDATLKFTGSGVGIDSIYTSDSVSTLDNVMAPVVFRAIDLSLVTAGGVGIRHGNKVGAYYDGRIINGSAWPDSTWPTSGNDGVRGWQFTNISGSSIDWTEQTVLGPNSGHHNCYIGCEFDINNSDTAALSFAYNTFQRYSIETNVPGQRGIVVRGSRGVGAQLYNGNFTIVGNNGNNTGTSQYVGTISGSSSSQILTSGTSYTSLSISGGITAASGVFDGQILLLKQVTNSGNPMAIMARGNNPLGATTLNVYQFTPTVAYSGGSKLEFASVGAVVGWPGTTASGWSSGTAYDASNWRTSSVFWKMEGDGDFSSAIWNVPLYVSTSGTFNNFGHLDFDTYSRGIVQNNGTFRIDGRYDTNAVASNPLVVASSLTVSGKTYLYDDFTAYNTFYIYPPSGQIGMVIQAAAGTINNLFSMKDSSGNTAAYIDYNGTYWSTPNPGTTSFRAQYRTDTNARMLIRNTGTVEFGAGGSSAIDTIVSRTASGTLAINSRSIVTTSGSGTATLSAGTVTVTNAYVTANSQIFLTAQDNNTTGALRVSARTAGTSFTITSSNSGDTGVVAYLIYNP